MLELMRLEHIYRVADERNLRQIHKQASGTRRSMLMIEEKIKRKISELISRSSTIVTSETMLINEQHYGLCEGWLVEARNIIQLAIPMPQNAYRQRIDAITNPEGKDIIRCVLSATEILRAVLRDIDDGLVGDLGNKVRAATLDDFLDHAESYRQDSQKMQAGVIAGVVFEDTIRRIYRDKFTDDDGGKQVETLINALARQNVITGQQSKQAKVAAHVRAKATHALWDEFDLAGVESTIQITKVFLREHLGG